MVRLVENRQREEEDQRGDHDAEQVTHLHLSGCAAENVPHLEILQHLTRYGGRDADHRRDAEHRGDATGAGDAQGHHQQGRNHQRAERQPRHGIIGGADHSHQISGDRGEEEAEHNHHQRRHHRAGDDFRAGKIPRAADEEVIQRDHRQKHHAHARKYHLGTQVAVGAVAGGMRSGGFLQIGDGARHADAQLLAHLEQSVGGAHQHSAHGDGAHHGEVNRLRQQRPGERLTARMGSLDGGSKNKGQQRNEQSPSQYAAGKIQGGKSRADDVADSQVSRAHVRRGEDGRAPGYRGGHVGIGAGAQQQFFAQRADADGKGVVRGKYVDRAQKVHQPAKAHVGEQNLGRFASLAGRPCGFPRRRRTPGTEVPGPPP